MGAKDKVFSKKRTLKIKGKLLEITRPLVMGIINVTPDSFFEGSRHDSPDIVEKICKKMIEEGADIIDVGAFSSRPGATMIPAATEMKRLKKALYAIRKTFPGIIVSVDTFRSEIAKKVVNDFEVDIINDISAGELDKNMFSTMANLQVPYIIMHLKGTPENMQQNTEYKNIIKEIMLYFSEKIQQLRNMGVHDIIIDPGFGFSKTTDHNFKLLQELELFEIFELPVLAGLSRKSMIYKTLDIKPGEALNGSTVLHTIALQKGVDILRVHDVKEAREAIRLVQRFMN